MSSKIDDPVDASFGAFPEEPEGLGAAFRDVAISLSGVVFPPAAILKILTDQFSNAERAKRIRYVLDALALKLKELERQMGEDRERIRSLKAYVESQRFREAAATACDEAARAADIGKVERMAKVLAGSLTPTRFSSADEDVASLIRNLAELGDRDVEALGKLGLAFGGLMMTNSAWPNDLFTDNNSAFERIVGTSAIEADDFYATCMRLIGFGLAVEVQWKPTRMQPHERCIRPTRRGLALLAYLRIWGS
jgi:hypothetical protein